MDGDCKFMIADLRRRLSQIALSLRRSTNPAFSTEVPRLIESDSFYLNGSLAKRKRIILRSGGCHLPTCTMCPFTNETLFKTGIHPTVEDYKTQFEVAFADDSVGEYDLVCVYNDGNFFAERELPSDARDYICRRVADAGCGTLMVESLPQFITAPVLDHTLQMLGSTRLCVGIGLQSANDLVRELCVNTRITRSQFLKAVSLLASKGCWIKVYVMLKPPFLTEREAIEDAVESIRYAYGLGIHDVTLCPTRVAPQTVAALLYEYGLYQPPWLWSIVDVLRQTANEGHVRVACLNLRSTDFHSVHPSNCDECTNRVTETIEAFNTDRILDNLVILDCECRKQYRHVVQQAVHPEQLIERVSHYLGIIRGIT